MKLSSYHHLVKEWHPTRNGDLTPNDCNHGSVKKVWWLCPKGHSYEADPNHRTAKNPRGCPYCSGRRASDENNLLALFPDTAKEWHPTKNGDLTPNKITYGSHKKVWWLCPKGHSYESIVKSKTGNNPTGCPYCSGYKASKESNLLVLFPEVAKEWHPSKNRDLTPDKVTSGAHNKVWWLCPNGHSYESIIGGRTAKNPRGCPYCSGRHASDENNLLALFPDTAKEWHPTKNGDLTPNKITYGSHKKVWWLCPKGHSYESAIKSRTGKNSTGCPNCSNQSSEPEIRILSELKWLFEDIKSRYKVDGVEIDAFLPTFNLGIEYDGSYWHKNKNDSDLEKNKFLLSKDIHLIRVRHYPLKLLSKNDVIVNNESLSKKDLDEILKKIYSFVGSHIKDKIKIYLSKSSFVNEELFKEYRSYFPSPFPENSLLATHPELSKEWDYHKNNPLTPENFSFGSKMKVWWVCTKGHSYITAISSRAGKRQSACPYCSGNKVSEDNSLIALFPEIAREWHPTKNGDLTPEDFTYGSNKKVWWLCPQGHSYESLPKSRTSKNPRGCPYCSGRKVGKDNNLLFLFPEIAKEWHPKRNRELTAKDLTYGSSKKVWWHCPKGHSYESTPKSRTRKGRQSGCPYCSGNKSLNTDLFS